MKQWYLSILLLLSVGLCAQNGYRAGDFDFSEFPKVSFVWHEYNPSRLNDASFALYEADEHVSLSVCAPNSTDCSASCSRSTIVLWEDMASQGQGMFRFSQSVLQNFFTSVVSTDQKENYYLATFNRHRSYEPVLRPLLQDFTCDVSALNQAVLSHERSTATYSERPNESDLFPAIHDALDLLQKRPSKEIKSIVVITTGMPIENSATNSVVSVQHLAQQYHIPIYILQYAANHGQSDKMQSLAEATYGCYACCISTSPSENIELGQDALRSFYQLIPQRYVGQDYLITYTTKAERSGDSQQLKLSVNGFDYYDTLIPPSYDFSTWVEDHQLLFYSAVAVVVIIIFLVLFFSIRSAKKRKVAEAAMAAMREHQTQLEAEAERKAKQQAEELKTYKENVERKETERRQQQALEEMTQLMHSKNLFPKLQYELNGQMVNYQIAMPEVRIGRDKESDLYISDSTVSRSHALIRFVGNGFMLEDLGSRNGTIVNGVPVSSPTMLNNNSLINLGVVLIKFYY